MHPLDEAQGYAALVELQPDTYTVESVASRVGRSPAYISGRLRLIQLIAEAKQAFYEDKLTVAHAFEIARLQPNDQRRALQECFPQYRNAAAILKDKKAEATTVRELRAWIEREIHLDLTNAPLDPQDETLLPKGRSVRSLPETNGQQPASISRGPAEVHLVVKWNRFGKRFSRFDAPFGPSLSLCLTGPFRSEGLRSRRRSV